MFASTPAGDIVFHPATAIDEPAIAAVRATVWRRLLQRVMCRHSSYAAAQLRFSITASIWRAARAAPSASTGL